MNKAFTRETDDAPPAPQEERPVSKALNLVTPRGAQLIKEQIAVIDALIERVIQAKSRKDLLTATRAMDRVLRAGHYWVPQWFKAAHHVVYWDKFSYPAVKPKYDRGILDTWWYDAEKAAKLKIN